ncbi:protein arginine methyltransferase NDUFAF7 homolog, mitochondrial [Leptopilina heterotoma]|uniref:protein arginine methyltransferase NDUFAF7 homolog, mitochondrial n=1 Tax=Leptopilina heterotoma TaxID=63436 RepID=UPI001CA90BB2|nr:protein arginine methyltransferase NDUFAF7 homolog, mitochondrial [Leptopilina heterotoma]
MLKSLKIVNVTKQFKTVLKRIIRHNSVASTTLQNDFSNSQWKDKSNLYKQLYSKILTCGPISIADYMKEVLTNPIDGYYMKKDVFGHKGDFVTSPEISQLFGEMIAVWILHEWKKISNKNFQLVELGPGRGTLSNDILRVFKQLQCADKVSLHLVEISPTLSEIQAKNLCASYEDIKPVVNSNVKNAIGPYRQGITKDGIKIFWYYSVNDVPQNFSVIIAHEFFDALPIHKFQKSNKGWHEVLIDIDKNSSSQEKFRYVQTKGPTLASKLYLEKSETRLHVEISPQTMVLVDTLANFLTQNGGFGLIIDYGHDGEKTDTFRSFREHKQHDPLLNPGTADLTADVDFSLIRKIATKNNRLVTFGPINQEDFLKQLGIEVRLQSLLKNATDKEKKFIIDGYRQITDANQMGSVFKVFSVFPAVLKQHLEKWPVSGFMIS